MFTCPNCGRTTNDIGCDYCHAEMSEESKLANGPWNKEEWDEERIESESARYDLNGNER